MLFLKILYTRTFIFISFYKKYRLFQILRLKFSKEC